MIEKISFYKIKLSNIYLTFLSIEILHNYEIFKTEGICKTIIAIIILGILFYNYIIDRDGKILTFRQLHHKKMIQTSNYMSILFNPFHALSYRTV